MRKELRVSILELEPDNKDVNFEYSDRSYAYKSGFYDAQCLAAELAVSHAAGAAKDGITSEESADLINSYLEAQGITQAAANKAAEEGGLPELPQEIEVGGEGWDFEDFKSQKTFSVDHMHEYARQAIAADRASRQVANKAEVEPAKFKRLSEDQVREIAMDHLHDDTESAARNGFFTFSAEGLDGFAIELMDALATPSATTGASTAIELDAYDAGLLSDFGGGDVNWWQDYIRAELDSAHDFYQSQVEGSVGASTALTDERIEKMWDAAFGSMDVPPAAYTFAREVAAQAGQVAVLGLSRGYESGTCTNLDLGGTVTLHYESPQEAESAFKIITDSIDAEKINSVAAPSPAKESK